jgi:hypothetical protein
MTRTFTDTPATRELVPVLAGLMGPSGGGKTFSALRLATGIQRVSGGEIFVIDTEARRALHYADRFKFRHVPFGAPFSPIDYMDAIQHCVRKGAKTIIVDSMSHEHAGPGGVLEIHEQEVERLSKGDRDKVERVKMLAWAKPKAMRNQLIQEVLQLGCNLIACFRAKEKLKIVPRQDPIPLGWMPIAGDEFVYEMTVNCLLPPAANGVPQWAAEHDGEKAMMKLPEQFRLIFAEPKPLSEDIGEQLARWAAGGKKETKAPPAEVQSWIDRCSEVTSKTALEAVESELKAVWDKLPRDAKVAIADARKQASERLAAAQ